MSEATALRIEGGLGLENLRVVSVPVEKPGPDEVRVQLRAASLNYRDWMTVAGVYNPKLALPRIPGSDAAGVVTAVGDRVRAFKVGDRVTSLFFQDWLDGPILPETGKSALGGAIDGVFVSERVFNEQGLIRTPEYLSDEEAATLPCAALTAWNALMEKGRVQAGETVVALGTGGVSLFALQFAKAAGARVIVTSSSDEKLERARKLGADEGINYRTTPEWDAEVLRLTGGRGADHVVELGGAGTLPRSLKAVRPEGHVYVIGVMTDGAGIDFRTVLSKSLHVDGVYVGSRVMFQRMNRAMEVNRIRPVIDEVFPLAEGRAALEHMKSGGHFGKLVLRME